MTAQNLELTHISITQLTIVIKLQTGTAMVYSESNKI